MLKICCAEIFFVARKTIWGFFENILMKINWTQMAIIKYENCYFSPEPGPEGL